MKKSPATIYNFLVKHAVFIGVIVALLATPSYIFGYISSTTDKRNNYIKKRDLAFSGIWTNPTEGCIDCTLNNDPNRPIILELVIKNGYINGVLDASGWLVPESLEELNTKLPNLTFAELEDIGINTEKFLKNEISKKIFIKSIFRHLNINGKLKGYKSEINIWDFIDGKKKILGKGNISLQGNILKLEMNGKHFLGIPSRAEMFKVYNKNGPPCKEIHEVEPYECKN